MEEILRIVSGQLLELGMNNAAAVTAAAVMGVEANAACPGDIAYRLLTRLLLVGKKAPRLSHAVPSVSTCTQHYCCSMKRIVLTVRLSCVISVAFILPLRIKTYG
ncbi:hypothetical protein NXV81_13985 [Bacteroides ovatus]|nr:hypothetical protein [Bacteroides ovatus]